MADELPAPPVPADCDLRGMEWMPMYGGRLFGSDFDAHASDAEFRAGVQLWWAAWNQVPASSLPADDVALCRLAGLGRDLKQWKRIKARAMHGFVTCSDGRLYHRALAAFAMESWDRRLKDRERKAKWREQRERRADRSGDGDRTRTETGTGRGQAMGQNAETGCDGTADAMRRDETRRDATRRDETLGWVGVGESGAGAPAGRPPTQVPDEIRERALAERAKRLPDGWQPDAELAAWARKQRPDLTDTEIDRQTERFVRHARDKGRVSHDWREAYRGWITDARGKFDAGPAGESFEQRRIREGLEALKAP